MNRMQAVCVPTASSLPRPKDTMVFLARRWTRRHALPALLASLLILALPSAAAARHQKKPGSSCRTTSSQLQQSKKHKTRSSCRKHAPKRLARASARLRRGDTIFPSAPGTPSAVGGDAQVALSWAPAVDNRGVAGYYVYRDGVQVAKTKITSFINLQLVNGRTYSFHVVAYDAAGNLSPKSPTVAATTFAAAPAPTPEPAPAEPQPTEPTPTPTPTEAEPPPTTATSPASRIYWGAYINGRDTYNHYYGTERTWQDAPWDYITWDRFEQNAGKKVALESFGLKNPMGGTTLDTYPLNRVRLRGALPVLNVHTSYSSSDPTNADVAAGKYDTQWRSWFTAVKAWGYPMFLVLDPEMNGPWSPYAPGVNGNTAESFVAMWRHLHDLASSVGATNITWVWCPNVDAANRFTPFEQLYPGDAYVDWTGLDGYNQGNMSWSYIFRSSYDRLVKLAPAKPIMISQTGSVDPAGTTQKAAWIEDSLTTQIPGYYNQIKALVWFNWRIWEHSTWQEWPIESSASGLAAFQKAISSPYYAPGGSFTHPAPGSKIKPL